MKGCAKLVAVCCGSRESETSSRNEVSSGLKIIFYKNKIMVDGDIAISILQYLIAKLTHVGSAA